MKVHAEVMYFLGHLQLSISIKLGFFPYEALEGPWISLNCSAYSALTLIYPE